MRKSDKKLTEKKPKNNKALIALISILLLGLVLRLIKINKNIFVDGAMSLFFSQHSLSEIWKVGLYDPHPPGYNYFLHFWQLISNDIVILTLSSVILGVLTIYMVYLIGKKLFDEKTGLIASLFLAINSLHIQISQELRMYVLMTLLLCLAFYFLLEKKLFLYALLGILSVWVEYFSILPLAVIALYGLIKEKFSKKILLTTGLMIISIAPIIFFILNSRAAVAFGAHMGIYWKLFIIPRIFSTYLLGQMNPYFHFYTNFPVINFNIIGLIFSLSFFAYLYYRFIKQKDKVIWLSLLIILPLLMPYLADFIAPIQLDARRFGFGLCILGIVLAKGLSSIKNFKLALCLLLLICSVPLCSFYNFNYPDYKGITNHIQLNEKEGDLVIIGESFIEYSIKFYYSGNADVKTFPYSINWSDKNWLKIRDYDPNDFNLIEGVIEDYERIWFIENKMDSTAEQQTILIENLKKEYNLKEMMPSSDGTMSLYLFEKP